MRPEFITLAVVLGVGTGASSPLPGLCIDHTLHVRGTFTADLRAEVSHDGTTWVELDAFTAPELVSYAGLSFKFIRIRTNAFTSQTGLVVTYGGMNTRVDCA